jgi:hypothetical protein
LRAVTAASGTAAPEASVTVPEKRPAVLWAKTRMVKRSRNR